MENVNVIGVFHEVTPFKADEPDKYFISGFDKSSIVNVNIFVWQKGPDQGEELSLLYFGGEIPAMTFKIRLKWNNSGIPQDIA